MTRAAFVLAACFGSALVAAQVPYDRLVRAGEEPHNWLTYSGNYPAHRFSPLTEINRDTVEDLKTIWVYQVGQVTLESEGGALVETTPLVVDGVMYLTEPPSTVTALDARTGRRLWTWAPTLPDDVLFLARTQQLPPQLSLLCWCFAKILTDRA